MVSWFCWKTAGCVILGFIIVPSIWYFYTRVKISAISLKNAKVLITGGSEGIGYEIAKHCLTQGSSIIILARNEDKLANAAERLERFKVNDEQEIGLISADVSNYDALAKEIADTFTEYLDWEYLDCVVCNAGVECVGSMESVDMRTQHRVMNVNYFGAVNCIKILLPYLKRHQTKVGRVIAVNSLLGLVAMPYYSAYTASKFALRGFIGSILPELAAYEIQCSIVYPPDVKTAQYAREKSAVNVPDAIRELSADAGVYEASVVGKDIVALIESGRYCRSWSLDGWMLVNLTAGFDITHNYLESMSQMFFNGLFRSIAMVYAKKFFTVGKHNTEITLG